VAIDEYLEGSLERDRLLQIIQRFEERVAEFEQRWGGLMETLFKDRLHESLRANYETAAVEMDRSLASLVETLALLQEFSEEGNDEALGPAKENLLVFFRLACGASALVLHELELEQLRQIRVGHSADFSL
jgi:hypothetical protein